MSPSLKSASLRIPCPIVTSMACDIIQCSSEQKGVTPRVGMRRSLRCNGNCRYQASASSSRRSPNTLPFNCNLGEKSTRPRTAPLMMLCRTHKRFLSKTESGDHRTQIDQFEVGEVASFRVAQRMPLSKSSRLRCSSYPFVRGVRNWKK